MHGVWILLLTNVLLIKHTDREWEEMRREKNTQLSDAFSPLFQMCEKHGSKNKNDYIILTNYEEILTSRTHSRDLDLPQISKKKFKVEHTPFVGAQTHTCTWIVAISSSKFQRFIFERPSFHYKRKFAPNKHFPDTTSFVNEIKLLSAQSDCIPIANKLLWIQMTGIKKWWWWWWCGTDRKIKQRKREKAKKTKNLYWNSNKRMWFVWRRNGSAIYCLLSF